MRGEITDLESRTEEAYKLRVQGYDSNEIAERLMMTPASVRELINRRMKREANLITNEERQGILHLELARLDALQAAHWEAAMFGDPKSTDAVLKIIALRSKLTNLDIVDPEALRAQVLVVGGSEEDYVRALQRAQDNTIRRGGNTGVPTSS